ncbi:hypothetical protein NIES2104_07330 [Leptolyngbya sp. NIES-2104]|nr:hypothetical protein NIES2104_07330 [Leptolyngbya sp. NIES-2104]
MGHETEIRGEQAGGGLVIAQNKNNQVLFVGKKVVNQKRQNLTQALETAFAPTRRKAMRAGIQPLDSAITAVWHYRYGTSSPPKILETHWHEWMPAREAIVWQLENGQWVPICKTVNHRITHNGDFNAWWIFGQAIDTTTLGLWLERVLHTPNATRGDSPKVAGMMDLLVTQGMWDASLRLAYQLEIAASIQDAFGGKEPAKTAPNTAPSQQALRQWAEICEEVWQKYKCPRYLSDKKNLSDFENQIVDISLRISPSYWSLKQRTAFVRTAIDAFLHNDIYRATQQFLSRAEGSFGLVTVSTLSAEHLVLSAQGQPMTIGFNVPEAYMIYASEPAAVNAVLAGMPESYRLDLDPTAGEVALVGINHITVYSLSQGREQPDAELKQRSLPMQRNPYVKPPTSETKDPVATDIREIPQVLNAIADDWSNPVSLNCRSAEQFTKHLVEKVKQDRKIDFRQRQTVDVLITGIENSLWLGERFAQDLKTLFPLLNVKALSANQILRQLQHAPQLHLGPNSIVLAISQSGQTFPTLQATQVLNELYCKRMIGDLFILTGELNSLMGAALSQSFAQGATFNRRIFTNGSGHRSAEAATLTVAATQATLTELLFYTAKRMRQAFPDSTPLGMTLTEKSLLMLDTIKADFLNRSVVALCASRNSVGTAGTTSKGESIKSVDHQKLMRQGRKWALHVTETPLVWAIHAVYVLIVLGWMIPFGQVLSVTQLLLRSLLFTCGFSSDVVLSLLALLHPKIVLIDIGIAIFGPWLWTIGIRFVQGRQLLARTGKRTIVIGDVPWVHQLLESYVSKLFSLSYGIASLEVHGANPQDHMVHRFGYRLVRGTLVLLGVPDGRRCQMQKEDENAALMTGKQADGVRSWGIGPEVVALGHNSAIAHQGFSSAIVLGSRTNTLVDGRVSLDQQVVIEELRETRFSSFERLLASYVLFWAFAKRVTSFPLLQYQHWKSQSRTRIATTAAPMSGSNLSLPQVESALSLAEPSELHSQALLPSAPYPPTITDVPSRIETPLDRS